MDTVASRLKEFIDNQGLSSTKFADECGIPRPNVSQLLNGRNKKVSDQLLTQIHTAFPMLSIMWLVFGEGEMLVSDKKDDEKPSNSENSGSDVKEFPDNGTDSSEYSKENGLKSDEKAFKITEAQLLELERKNAALTREIGFLKENPRKVQQIMVYYDDSTFEIFVPK